MPITFKHFNRKGWSLFCALGREVRIGVLSVATLATATACFAQASAPVLTTTDDASNENILKEAAISAVSLAPMAADLAVRQVMTLGRDDLAAAGVTSINDILKLAIGVDVRQRGGFGVQSDISLSGGTHDQVTILVNGVSVCNAQTGHNASDFPLNIADILRVEVLEGGAARVFGSQAFSGAINIVTKSAPAQRSATDINIAGGMRGTAQAGARTAWRLGQWGSTSLSGSYQRSDGLVHNGDFQGGKAFWQGNAQGRLFHLRTQVGFTQQAFGANTFYSGAYPNQWESTRRHLASVCLSSPLTERTAEKGGGMEITFAWLRNSDHFQLVRGTSFGENFNRSDAYTASAKYWRQWCLGRTAISGEIRREHLLSRNLGQPLDTTDWVRIAGQDSLRYNKHDGRTNIAFSAEHNIILQQWTISLGVMAQQNSYLDHRFRFYPGIDATYRPSRHWQLFASWNRSLRLPTFTDLYYKSPTIEGNIGLRPEHNDAFRIGANYHMGTQNYQVAVQARAFFDRGTDMIDWVMYTPTDTYHAANFQLNNMGASINGELRITAGRWQFIRRVTAGYAYLHQVRRDAVDIYKSNYALEYLRHKFTASLQHSIWHGLTATWNLSVRQRQGAYIVYEHAVNTGQLRPYGTHAQLDIKVEYLHVLPHARIIYNVSATNITNHRYYDLANVRQPGIYVQGGATLSF